MFLRKLNFFSYAYRKLLKEDQLEAGTKAAQQEEMERRKRLEQQRKDFPAPPPTIPDSQLGDCRSKYDLSSHIWAFCDVPFFLYFLSQISSYFPISPIVDAASLLGDVSHLVPALLSKQDVICLDSSGDEDEKVDPKLPALAIRDGKILDTQLFSNWFQTLCQ